MDDSEELTKVTGKAGEQRLLISQGEAEAVSLGGHHHQWGEGWKASIAVRYVLTFRKALVSRGRLVLSDRFPNHRWSPSQCVSSGAVKHYG